MQSIVNTHLVVDVYGYFTDVEELAGFNTALGDRALLNNTTGTLNTATGVLCPPKQHHGRPQHRHGGHGPPQQHHGRRQHRHGV